jgi:diguanylate cyclase (GGDEF)-like protein
VSAAATGTGECGPASGTGEARVRPLILVVDDDPHIAQFVYKSLQMEGFDVVVAHEGKSAIDLVFAKQPDLVVLDLMMPVMDGVEVTRQLRRHAITSALPIIMLTAKAKTSEKVLGLEAGADDYVVKPFDTLELVARIRSTLRRNQDVREASPLTSLPGNIRILREVGDRLRFGDPFAVCYCDIDGFKAVNDAYGFLRGDEFIVTLARMLQRAVLDAGEPRPFLGHVGGDDFVVVCTPDQVLSVTDQAITAFERAADLLYDPADRDRRYLSVKSRRDGRQDVGLVTVSVGVALSSRRSYTDPRELIADASEMKSVAKTQPGSFVAVDRRIGP